MDDAERYWYSFRFNAWFGKSGTQLHSNTMEPIVRGSDYDAAQARIRQLESQLAACKIARDGFTATRLMLASLKRRSAHERTHS